MKDNRVFVESDFLDIESILTPFLGATNIGSICRSKTQQLTQHLFNSRPYVFTRQSNNNMSLQENLDRINRSIVKTLPFIDKLVELAQERHDDDSIKQRNKDDLFYFLTVFLDYSDADFKYTFDNLYSKYHDVSLSTLKNDFAKSKKDFAVPIRLFNKTYAALFEQPVLKSGDRCSTCWCKNFFCWKVTNTKINCLLHDKKLIPEPCENASAPTIELI